jgi:hypothetical protein
MLRTKANLAVAARLCPTWIQTCLFAIDGAGPDEVEQGAYIDFLRACAADQIAVRGVLLYGLARPSLQPEASRLSPLPAAYLQNFAERVRALGVVVKLTP